MYELKWDVLAMLAQLATNPSANVSRMYTGSATRLNTGNPKPRKWTMHIEVTGVLSSGDTRTNRYSFCTDGAVYLRDLCAIAANYVDTKAYAENADLIEVKGFNCVARTK